MSEVRAAIRRRSKGLLMGGKRKPAPAVFTAVVGGRSKVFSRPPSAAAAGAGLNAVRPATNSATRPVSATSLPTPALTAVGNGVASHPGFAPAPIAAGGSTAAAGGSSSRPASSRTSRLPLARTHVRVEAE